MLLEENLYSALVESIVPKYPSATPSLVSFNLRPFVPAPNGEAQVYQSAAPK